MARKSSGTTRTPTTQDIPFEEIQEAAKSFTTCTLRVTRKNAKNELQSIVSGMEKPVLELMEIDAWLSTIAGGGHFRVEARNPKGGEPLHVVQPFMVHIEGPPKPVAPLGDIPAGASPLGFGGPGFGSPGFGAPGATEIPGSRWAAGLPPGQQQHYMQQGAQQMFGPMTPPWARQQMGGGSRYPSDELALRQVADLKEEMAKHREEAKAERERREADQRRAEERLEEQRRQHEREMAELRRREEEERRRSEERERERERRAQDERYQQLQMQMQQQAMAAQQAALAAQPKTDWVAQLLPLVMAYITSQKDRDALTFQQQQAQQQQQMSMMQALLQAGRGDDKMMELLIKQMEAKSPEAQAAMLQAMLDMQITSAGAIANLVQSLAPENPPVWLQAVMGGLDTVQGIAQDVMQQMRTPQQPPQAVQYGQLQHQQAPMPPQVHVPQVQAPAAPPQVDPVQLQQEVDAIMEIDPGTQERLDRAAAKVDQLAMLLPQDFRTQEWRLILIHLHAEMPADDVAIMLAKHLAHLMDFRGLPRMGFDGFQQNPEEVLHGIVRYLPIWSSNEAYAREVIANAVVALRHERYLPPLEAASASDPGSSADGEGEGAGEAQRLRDVLQVEEPVAPAEADVVVA